MTAAPLRQFRFITYRVISRLRRLLLRLEETLYVPERGQLPFPQSVADLALRSIPRTALRSVPRQSDPAVVLLGHLDSSAFFGGIATAVLAAGLIAEMRKQPLEIVCLIGNVPASSDMVEAIFRRHDISPPSIKILDLTPEGDADGRLGLGAKDVFIASSWWDAAALATLLDDQPFIYLVQDFEPNFYPVGDSYAMAEATYSLPNALPLINSSILREWFEALGYADFIARGQHFEPARLLPLNKRVGNSCGGRLFFYGRSNIPRNLFSLGLLALDLVSADARSQGWEFIVAGDGSFDDLVLKGGQPLRNLGKLTPEAYEAFAQTVDVALSPMLAPHPNYPTLEFASLGAEVVTTRFGTKTDLSRYSDRITLTEATAESMATGLLSAMNRQRDSYAQATLPANWRDSLKVPVEQLLATFAHSHG